MTISTRSGRSLPPNTILGRRGGRGAPVAIPLNEIIQQAGGSVAGAGGGGGGSGSGTVTSVAMTMPSDFSIAGSPVTSSGTLAVTRATQSANEVLAGPPSGSAAAPSYRALVAADLPSIADGDVLSNNSGSSGAPSGNSIGATLDHGLSLSTDGFVKRTGTAAYAITSISLTADVTGILPVANGGIGASTISGALDAAFSSTQGDILYRGASDWAALAPGSSGQVLTSGGAAANPSWADSSSGTDLTNGGTWAGNLAYSISTIVDYQSAVYVCIDAVTAPASTVTWDSSTKGANITLSGGDTIATSGASTYQSVLANVSDASGKFYFEMTATAVDGISFSTGLAVGLGDSSTSLSGSGGADLHSIGFFNTGAYNLGGTTYNGAWKGCVTGDVLGVAVDLTGQLIWVQNITSDAGNWNTGTSGTQNPATGSGGISLSTMASSTLFPLASIVGATGQNVATINPGPTFAGTKPSGFTAWSTATNTAPPSDATHWRRTSTDTEGATNGQLLIGSTATGGMAKATLTAGSNVTITNGGGSVEIASAGSSNNAAVSTTGSTPPGFTNTSAFLMAGLAVSITPATTGRVLVLFSTSAKITTVGDRAFVQVNYGTGTAPANGAAETGTTAIASHTIVNATTAQQALSTMVGVVTGLTVGTTYWFDAAVEAVDGGETFLGNPTIALVEI